MGAVFDIYQLIRDLKEKAEKQKNLELVSGLIDIKNMVSDLEDENKELKRRLELKEKIVRHADGTYITLQDDEQKIHYCAICWGRDGKLIQLSDRGCFECAVRWQN